MKFSFYYDESEHSRKINQNTINASNFASNFVCSIIGLKSNKAYDVFNEYAAFENLYMKQRQVSELKSETIKPKQIKYGFASLSKNNKEFINHFFNFVIDQNLYSYFAIVHKIEYIIIQLFASYQNSFMVDMDSLRYTLTKLIDVYRPKEVLESIYINDGTLIEKLKNFIQKRIVENDGLEHKNQENIALEQVVEILEGYEEEYIIDWNYKIAFDGFKKYLAEKNIDNYTLTLDREGKGNTLISALSAGLKNVSEIASHESIGVRISDIFTGIISKLIRSIDNDLRYRNEDEYKEMKYLSDKWFMVDQASFDLYKKFAKIIYYQNRAWYKSYSGNYSDIFTYFLSLLKYFEGYKSLKELNSVSVQQHKINVNNLAVSNLEEHSKLKRSKLPIDFVSNKEKEYYYNKKGALVYFDFYKHEILPIPKDLSGIKYKVLSVGFFGKMEKPCITVEEINKAVCYLLPDQLMDWAILSVGLANLGTDIFPTDVIFNYSKGKYYADVL
jgi:hypothetical protein